MKFDIMKGSYKLIELNLVDLRVQVMHEYIWLERKRCPKAMRNQIGGVTGRAYIDCERTHVSINLFNVV